MSVSTKNERLVCQLPGCKTTHKDVQSALEEYLEGYCTKCAKKRDGTLCGCSFPCNLTFKGQMLEKIHQLIGQEVAHGVKSIQVCFKHPELLKLARESCIATRSTGSEESDQTGDKKEKDGLGRFEDGSRFSKVQSVKTVRINQNCSVMNLSSNLLTDAKIRMDISEDFSMLPESDHREFLRQIESQGDILGSRDCTENMTGIVYTDEGGQEQSLLGKLVYTTDETGSGNIILQEVGVEGIEGGVPGRIMKIQLGEIPNFVLEPEDMTTEGRELRESLVSGLHENMNLNMKPHDPILPEDTGGRSILTEESGGANILPENTQGRRILSQEPGYRRRKLQDLLEPATNNISLQHAGLNRRKLGGIPLKGQQASRTIKISRKPTPGPTWNPELQNSVLVGLLNPEKENLLPEKVNLLNQEKEPFSNTLKIQYKEFEEKLITSQIPSLLSHGELCDVLLICSDGEMLASGMVLASISPFLKDLFHSVPRIDNYRVVILPDCFTISNMALLNRIIFQDVLDDVEINDLDNLISISQTLQCHQIAEFCESRIISLTTDMRIDLATPPAEVAAEEEEEEEEEEGRMPQLNHTIVIVDQDGAPRRPREGSEPEMGPGPGKKRKKTKGTESPLTSLKIDKTQLNADYLDDKGIVRLASRDEMALHYCILCEKKFKKYNQAITHYKSQHLLEAMLSCDVCDQLFKDMFSCVKHKHEVHGDFERNLQCYLCMEVFYSRFRLSSHVKEIHKEVYCESTCKTCGMKFPAEHYLTMHAAEDHKKESNSCNICGKTFSGKRYVTMHIKNTHQMGGKFDFQCKYCFQSFQHNKTLIYHCIKQHKEDKPDGIFEECSLCDKFFKRKGELKQHMKRKHKQLEFQNW